MRFFNFFNFYLFVNFRSCEGGWRAWRKAGNGCAAGFWNGNAWSGQNVCEQADGRETN